MSYRPQENDFIEVFHKTLNRAFRRAAGPAALESAEEVLAMALYAYRSTIHFTTGYSPAFLLFGRDLPTPYADDWRRYEYPERQRLLLLNLLRKDILDSLLRLYELSAARALSDEPKIEVNDLALVHLNTHELYTSAVQLQSSEKVIIKWTLPVRVIAISNSKGRVTVKNLLTWETKEVAISEVRKIALPDAAALQDEWQRVIADALSETYCEARIKRYCSELGLPQDAKRRR